MGWRPVDWSSQNQNSKINGLSFFIFFYLSDRYWDFSKKISQLWLILQNFDSHSRDVREELHKRKSLACRLNTDCFRVALPRMGHPGSRDFTFQYLQLPQIFTTTECPDIHVPQSRDPAFFSSRQSDHTGLPHCSKSLRDKTIFIFKKNSTLLYSRSIYVLNCKINGTVHIFFFLKSIAQPPVNETAPIYFSTGVFP